MSSLLCHCGGIIRPSNPMDQESSYSCDQCGLVLDNTYVIILETQLKDDLELCYTNDTIALEEVLRFIEKAYIYIIRLELGNNFNPGNPDKELNRQELLTQPMRVQICRLLICCTQLYFQNQSKINSANKEYSDWLGGNQ